MCLYLEILNTFFVENLFRSWIILFKRLSNIWEQSILRTHLHSSASVLNFQILFLCIISINDILRVPSTMKVSSSLNAHIHNWIIFFTGSVIKGIRLSLFYFFWESFIFNYVNVWHVSNWINSIMMEVPII